MRITIQKTMHFRTYDVDSLQQGEIVVNAYHDPERLSDNAGIYMVINKPSYARTAPDGTPFVVNLRSGNVYTYSYMKSRTTKNGGVYKITADLTISVDR